MARTKAASLASQARRVRVSSGRPKQYALKSAAGARSSSSEEELSPSERSRQYCRKSAASGSGGSHEDRPRQTARKSAAGGSGGSHEDRPRQTARKSAAGGSGGSHEDRPRQTARKSAAGGSGGFHNLFGGAPAVQRSASEASGGRGSSHHPLVGDWELKSAEAEDYNCGGHDLTLTVFCADGRLCGNFWMGCVEGSLKLDVKLRKDMVGGSFKWRGRETGEGEMQIDTGSNRGELRLKGVNGIKGNIQTNYGDLKFTGKRVSKDPSTTYLSMWEGMDYEQYERERVGRWR